MKSADKRKPYYITEWRTSFDQGVGATLAFMTDLGEHATQLRESSPFAGTLSENRNTSSFSPIGAKSTRNVLLMLTVRLFVD